MTRDEPSGDEEPISLRDDPERTTLSRTYAVSQPEQTAVRRLGSLARLTETDLRKIADAAADACYFPGRTEIVREGSLNEQRPPAAAGPRPAT